MTRPVADALIEEIQLGTPRATISKEDAAQLSVEMTGRSILWNCWPIAFVYFMGHEMKVVE